MKQRAGFTLHGTLKGANYNTPFTNKDSCYAKTCQVRKIKQLVRIGYMCFFGVLRRIYYIVMLPPWLFSLFLKESVSAAYLRFNNNGASKLELKIFEPFRPTVPLTQPPSKSKCSTLPLGGVCSHYSLVPHAGKDTSKILRNCKLTVQKNETNAKTCCISCRLKNSLEDFFCVVYT